MTSRGNRPFVALLALLILASIALPAAASSGLGFTPATSKGVSSAAEPLTQAHALQAQAARNDYRLHVSSSANRGRSQALDETGLLTGRAFIFVTPAAGVARVRYFLDLAGADAEGTLSDKTPYFVADKPPFQLDDPNGKGNQKGLDTTQLADGLHTITAAIDLSDGSTVVKSPAVQVHNGRRALLFGPDKLQFKVAQGGRDEKALRLFVSNGASADYTLSSDAPWLTFEAPSPIGNDRKGSTPDVRTLNVNAAGLAPGKYTATVTAQGSDAAAASTTVTLDVAAATTCSPLPCNEIMVKAPYSLDFKSDAGKITDGNGVGTGFTYVQQPSNATGYIPQKLAVNTGGTGTFNVTTTSGLMFTTSNSQDNALGVGVDAPDQVSLIETTVVNPPVGTGNYEQGGVYFGNDQDNYLKLEILSEPGPTTRIEYLFESGGARTGSYVTGPLSIASSSVMLRMRANPTDRTVAAYFSINGADLTQLGTFVVPGEFFSFDAAGIDPEIGTRSFGGIFTSHRYAQAALTYAFDAFSVTAEPPPTPGTELNFNRVSYALPNPTSMVWGPDNRLYVTEMFGKIHALTLDANKNVTADQVITTLGSRLTLGITFDPASTPSNLIMWVSHSSPSTDAGELNSSTVSRLTGPNFTTREDIITGLPRAIANHAINSIHFGPDGRLYIANGGNTGAGAPNTANTEFGTRAEQPLSAAFLVADVKAPGFDGSCATPENSYGPSPCDVHVYSSGLRNMYDFVWHSNGYAYGPVNGLGVTGSYPPVPTAPCEGYGDTTSWTQGGDNPGTQPDLFHRLIQGKMYGHPNPYRNECVFGDGHYQGVSPSANYLDPIHTMGMDTSSDGTIEYTSDAFSGTLKSEILITNYSVGDDITRIRLSADGTQVLEAKQLVGGFNDPLPIAQGPDGTIYVGELGAQQITALIPAGMSQATPTVTPTASPTSSAPGAWTTKQKMPVALLDSTGAELGGKLYAVAGKITGDIHQRSLYIYNPATNSWSQGPDLPAAYPAVENPGVASYNGKLYVFAGSTAAFSGSVTNAAVYDPATNQWTMLASMTTGRGGPTAQVLNGKIYVIGGMDNSGASLNSVEVYDPATNTWGTAASMLERRDNPGSAVLGGKIYVFGGRTRNADGTDVNGTLASVEMFDPATNTWTARAAMPTGRRTMVTGYLNGRAQLIGGERTSTGGAFSQNEEYDPTLNAWRTLQPMLTPRHGAAGATINDVIYVAGGGPTGGSAFTDVNEAFSLGGTATATPTATGVAATATPTRTFTPTPQPATATATPTQPAATATPTRTFTPTAPPATATATPTRTATQPAATATPTRTPTQPASTATPTKTPAPASYTVMLSRASDRSNAVPLAGQTVSGNIYVFVSPESGASKVSFYLDNPSATGTALWTETNPPWDFAGGTVSTANPYSTTKLTNGSHSITAKISLTAGGSTTTTANFTVNNAP